MTNKSNKVDLDDLFPERRKTLLQIVNKIKHFSFEKTNEYDNVENVLLVQGGYGTGKTFFAKKLNDCLLGEGVDSVYFSAWEKDYVNQPFVVISRVILKEIFKNKNIVKNAEKFISDKFKKIMNYIISKDFNIKLGTGPLEVDTNISLQEIINAIKDQKDPIAEFKDDLSTLINKLKNKKLVLIVDELDRCRPDYAMKVLEIIKHFFDIDGLIVIVLSNIKALNNSVKSLYNFENNNNEESYLTKFFVDKVILNPINYEKFIVDTLSQKLKINKKNLQEENTVFNSLYILKNSLVNLSKQNNITCRELNLIIKKVCEFYKIRKNNKYNDWQYIVDILFNTANHIIINKERLYTDNSSFYSNIKNYCENKNKILNPGNFYKQSSNDYITFFRNDANIIFFCFPNILELYSFNTNYIPIQTSKEYFEKAKKRDEMLETDPYERHESEVNKLKELLQPYDLDVKKFNDKYGDLDDLKEEDIIKEKEEVDNIIKSILMLNN